MYIFQFLKIFINLKKNHYDLYNCGYGNGFSILEIIKEFEKIIGKKINFKIGKRREGDAEVSVANVKKITSKFNWEPKNKNLRKILESALEWEKKIKSQFCK